MCLLTIAMSLKQSAETMIRRNKHLVAILKSLSTDIIYIIYQANDGSGHPVISGGRGGAG